MKKKLALLMIMLLCLPMLLTPIGGGLGTDKWAEAAGNVDIWSAPNTEKIMRNGMDYSAIKGSGSVNVRAAKGEYESGQLIITPDYDVAAYDITFSPLKLTGNESVVFPEQNIELYAHKYINVTQITTTIKVPTGQYPDAMLPFAIAKKYGENIIAKNDNQGIHVTFNVPANQQAGIYSGKLTITLDGEAKEVPVKLEVWDFAVSSKVNTKSIFLNQWTFESGELNSSQEMLNAYHNKLTEFRLSPDILVKDNTHSDEDIAYYADLAYEFAKNERFSNYSIPAVTFYDSSVREVNLDTIVVNKYIMALVNKSFEQKFDLLSKAVMYIGAIDEPLLNGTQGRAQLISNTFEKMLKDAADKLQADNTINSPLKEQVVASIRNIKNVVTSEYNPSMEAVNTWCPLLNDLDSDGQRAKYEKYDELWTYTCTGPKNPYPSYHIDDILISSRVMGWMQADYDIAGILYWATNIYEAYRGGEYVSIEDYYQTADRFPSANGDGFLFYPGKKYGINEPIASIRLHSIRDGLEEYEMLTNLESKYQAIANKHAVNNGVEDVLRMLYDNLYSGTRVLTTSRAFERARNNLAQLTLLAESKAEVVVSSVNISDVSANLQVLVKDGYTLRSDGEEVTNYTQVDGGKLYNVEKSFGHGGIKAINLSVEIDGKNYDLNISLGGIQYAYSAEEILSDLEITSGGTTEISSVSGQSGKFVKLNIDRVPVESKQVIKVMGESLSKVGSAAKTLTIKVFNSSADKIPYDIRFKYKNERLNYIVKSGDLNPGYNELTIDNLFGFSWQNYGSLEHMLIYIGTGGDNGEPARNYLYVQGMSLTMND